MARSVEGIVGQSLQGVANVQNDLGLVGGLDAAEITRLLLVLHLQPAYGVLEQHRDGAEVCVFCDPSRGAIGQFCSWDRRIMEKTEFVLGFVVQCCHLRRGDSEGIGECGENLQLDLEAAVVEVFHEATEAGELFFRDPDVIHEAVMSGAHIERFLYFGLSIKSCFVVPWWGWTYLDVSNRLSLGKPFLISTDTRDGLLSNIAVSTVGRRLGRMLCDHLVFQWEVKEFASLWI